MHKMGFLATVRTAVKKLSKSLKVTPECDKMCRTTYLEKYDAFEKKVAKRLRRPYHDASKTQLNSRYHMCRKTFCNKSCKGFKKKWERLQIKNGFQAANSQKRTQILLKKGAMSECYPNKMI